MDTSFSPWLAPHPTKLGKMFHCFKVDAAAIALTNKMVYVDPIKYLDTQGTFEAFEDVKKTLGTSKREEKGLFFDLLKGLSSSLVLIDAPLVA